MSIDEELLDQLMEGRDPSELFSKDGGSSPKTVLTGSSKLELSIPRDRSGTFEPKLIAKYKRRFPEFDDKIISMYARGMTLREIRGHLGGAPRHRCVAGPDLDGDGCGAGNGDGMAEPGA